MTFDSCCHLDWHGPLVWLLSPCPRGALARCMQVSPSPLYELSSCRSLSPSSLPVFLPFCLPCGQNHLLRQSGEVMDTLVLLCCYDVMMG